MSPDVESSPLPSEIRFSNHQIFLDIVYNPIETVLLRRARRDGAHAINGVEMLVQQGAAAFQLWTGKAFPVDVGRRAVTEALKGR
jgi:shikimate dehydrogenase